MSSRPPNYVRQEWEGRLPPERPPWSSERNWQLFLAYLGGDTHNSLAAQAGLSRSRVAFIVAQTAERLDGDDAAELLQAGVPVRLVRLLLRNGIRSPEELLSQSPQELLMLRGLGEKNLGELREYLLSGGA